MHQTPSNNLTILFANAQAMMLPMVEMKGNATECLYKALNYAC
jgi:hypothetical protein